jgi:protein-tyrosine phosphatase
VIRVCFVCLGNICRSPTAEAVMVRLLGEAGLTDRVHVSSAGTGDWHLGEPADRRTAAAAARRGYALDDHHAQQFTAADFARCDLIVAMDQQNQRDLLAMAPDDAARAKVRLLRSFDPAAPPGADVPDPYYGGAHGFEEVLDICERACRGLIEHLRAR